MIIIIISFAILHNVQCERGRWRLRAGVEKKRYLRPSGGGGEGEKKMHYNIHRPSITGGGGEE